MESNRNSVTDSLKNHPTREWYYLDGDSGYLLDLRTCESFGLADLSIRFSNRITGAFRSIVKDTMEAYREESFTATEKIQ